MPKNKRGGNKAKKGKNTPNTSRRPLIVKDKNINCRQLYGMVTKKCGGCPPILEIECEDGVKRRCVVRGKQRKRVWMEAGNTVLICYNENALSGEILVKYENSEVRKLINMGELNENTFKDDNVDDNDNCIVFDTGEQETDVNEITYDNKESSNINLDDI
jgi:translation initiation factor 1A